MNYYLGIELGSTRIKAVLIDESFEVCASGSHTWKDSLQDGYWTYSLADVWSGIQDAYADMAARYEQKEGKSLTKIAGFGVSAMMHGYLPFDEAGNQLAGFRTWRNTTTGQAARELTEVLGFNIPQRWSISHLYQAILNGEEHVTRISYLTTLAGYVHWKLTGEKIVGNGEASGMFPIDSQTGDYDAKMMETFDQLIEKRGYSWRLRDILPKVAYAGEHAGVMSAEGAKLLDISGKLLPGAVCAPPEGDAGTGMVATNSVAQRTGNVSAGTSVFAMIVLDHALSKVYPEIDMVTTPDGYPVAMVHCNTCTSDLNAWVSLMGESIEAVTGQKPDTNHLYTTLFQAALQGDPDCGGLVNVGYYSGEPVTGFEDGRPLFVRRADAPMSLGNFMRAQINGAVATLRMGMDLLIEQEHVSVETMMGHGGLFQTPIVGQRLAAAAMNVPVAVMETASEGGPWGMAILAAYAAQNSLERLDEYLSNHVFAQTKISRMEPDAQDVAGFNRYLENFKAALAVERAAVDAEIF